MEDYEPYYKALEEELGRPSGAHAPFLSFIDGGRPAAVQWDGRNRAFLIRVHVGPLPAYGRLEVLKKLLAANFLMAETNGGALDCDTARNEAGVSFRLSADGLDTGAFVAFMRAACETARRLGDSLQEENARQARLAAQRIAETEAELAAENGDEAAPPELMPV